MIPGRGKRTGALLAATAAYLRETRALEVAAAFGMEDDLDPQQRAAETFRVIEQVKMDRPEEEHPNVIHLLIGEAFIQAVAADLIEDFG